LLSYRHAFHAGNHADVLKHFLLAQVLDYKRQKDKPFWYIDTHAGAGLYALDTGYATQNAEFENGINKLLDAKNLPQALQDYVFLIQQFNQQTVFNQKNVRLYPGSPAIAQHFLRSDDKMRLFELHPNDHKLLSENFTKQLYKVKNGQVKIDMQDGFAGLKAILPPPPRRAVVLIDPPYENKQDYQYVISACKNALSRFTTGTYMVWYPLLQRPEPDEMVDALIGLHVPNWLNVSMTIEAPSAEGFGMFGSGMFIINPPWQLQATLTECMPVLTELLAIDSSADFLLEGEAS